MHVHTRIQELWRALADDFALRRIKYMNIEYRVKEKIKEKYDGTNFKNLLINPSYQDDPCWDIKEIHKSFFKDKTKKDKLFKFKEKDVLAFTWQGDYVVNGNILVYSFIRGDYKKIETALYYDAYIETKDNTIQNIYCYLTNTKKEYKSIPEEAYTNNKKTIQHLVPFYEKDKYLYIFNTNDKKRYDKIDIKGLM